MEIDLPAKLVTASSAGAQAALNEGNWWFSTSNRAHIEVSTRGPADGVKLRCANEKFAIKSFKVFESVAGAVNAEPVLDVQNESPTAVARIATYRFTTARNPHKAREGAAPGKDHTYRLQISATSTGKGFGLNRLIFFSTVTNVLDPCSALAVRAAEAVKALTGSLPSHTAFSPSWRDSATPLFREGTAGTVVPLLDSTFSLLTSVSAVSGALKSCLAAGACFEKGTALVFAHDTYLKRLGKRQGPEAGAHAKLLARILQWGQRGGGETQRSGAKGCDAGVNVALLGFANDDAGAFEKLVVPHSPSPARVSQKTGAGTVAALAQACRASPPPDVVFFSYTSGQDLSRSREDAAAADAAAAVLNFIRDGGTLVTAICPWGWESARKQPGALKESNFLARVLLATGLCLTTDYASPGPCLLTAAQDLNCGLAVAEVARAVSGPEKCPAVLRSTVAALLPLFDSLPPSLLAVAGAGAGAAAAGQSARDGGPDGQIGRLLASLLALRQRPIAFPVDATCRDEKAAVIPASAALDRIAAQVQSHAATAPTAPAAGGGGRLPAIGGTGIFPPDASLPAAPASGRGAAAAAPAADPRVRDHAVGFAGCLPGWQSSGLYALRGEACLISFEWQKGGCVGPPEKFEVIVRVGCHKDRLGAKLKLDRHPDVCATFRWRPTPAPAFPKEGADNLAGASAGAVEACPTSTAVGSTLRVSANFNGLIYVEVPSPKPGSPPFTLRFSGGAILSPWYCCDREAGFEDDYSSVMSSELKACVSGPKNAFKDVGYDKTTPWKNRLQKCSRAPFGEVEGALVCFSLPTSGLELIQDPLALVRYWDKVLFAQLTLAGQVLARKERLVADRQISAGYLHAGYPVMTHLDVVRPANPWLVNLEKLRVYGSWGIFHEFGHNRQSPSWTFEGTSEVTVNIFSLHACSEMLGQKPLETNWVKERHAKMANYIQNTKCTFQKDWKDKPDVALGTYAFFLQRYGFEAMARVFAAYRKLGNIPNESRIDEWIIQTSVAVGADLRDFYCGLWKWPVRNKARVDAACAKLPQPPPWQDLLKMIGCKD